MPGAPAQDRHGEGHVRRAGRRKLVGRHGRVGRDGAHRGGDAVGAVRADDEGRGGGREAHVDPDGVQDAEVREPLHREDDAEEQPAVPLRGDEGEHGQARRRVARGMRTAPQGNLPVSPPWRSRIRGPEEAQRPLVIKT